MKKPLLILAGVLVVIAGIVFYRQKSRIDSHSAWKVSDGHYRVQAQAGVWIDTEVYVGPNYKVIAGGDKPFYLAVGDASQFAPLGDSVQQKFYAEIWTFPKRVPPNLLPKTTAWVDSQEKIYFYAERFSNLEFSIEPLDPVAVQAIESKLRYAGESGDGGNVVGAAVVGILLGIMFIIMVAWVVRSQRTS